MCNTNIVVFEYFTGITIFCETVSIYINLDKLIRFSYKIIYIYIYIYKLVII